MLFFNKLLYLSMKDTQQKKKNSIYIMIIKIQIEQIKDYILIKLSFKINGIINLAINNLAI